MNAPSSAPVPASTSPRTPVPVDPVARGASLVAAGIFLSKIIGLVRLRVFAHYLGTSPEAGAFVAALRIPNFLQNLLGEGVLAGSFVPVYARLLEEDRRKDADELAGGIFGLLCLVLGLLVALGMVASPWLVDVLAPGFEGELRVLTLKLVRILFPAIGLLVLSAWCLGILNSHRRFLLSYASPVVWNGALIVTLLGWGGRTGADALVTWLAYGTVVGSFLQFAVQLPSVLKLLGRLRPHLRVRDEGVRQTLRSFGPVVLARGVVQVSAFVDNAVATLVSARVAAALFNAQTLYLLPVALFGMSVSVSELTEMSRARADRGHGMERLRERLERGCAHMAFFVVPSAAAFLVLGDVVAGAVVEGGRFGASDTRLVWLLLMGSTWGLLASAQGRLFASGFYALQDTRSPLLFAAARVSLGALLAWVLTLGVPTWLGISPELASVGLTLAGGMAAWMEFLLLRRGLERHVGRARIEISTWVKLWGAAWVSALVGLAVKLGMSRAFGTKDAGGLLPWLPPPPNVHPVFVALGVLGAYGMSYFALTGLCGVPQAQRIWRKVGRRMGVG